MYTCHLSPLPLTRSFPLLVGTKQSAKRIEARSMKDYIYEYLYLAIDAASSLISINLLLYEHYSKQ